MVPSHPATPWSTGQFWGQKGLTKVLCAPFQPLNLSLPTHPLPTGAQMASLSWRPLSQQAHTRGSLNRHGCCQQGELRNWGKRRAGRAPGRSPSAWGPTPTVQSG